MSGMVAGLDRHHAHSTTRHMHQGGGARGAAPLSAGHALKQALGGCWTVHGSCIPLRTGGPMQCQLVEHKHSEATDHKCKW